MKNRPLLADFILLLVAFVWGATFVLVENAIAFLPPFLFNALRFTLASVSLFIVIFIFYRRQLMAIDWKLMIAGIILGVWLFSGYLFQTAGLLYTSSSKAGFITGLSVVLVPLFSFLIMKQKISINAALGIIVATAGLYLLTAGDVSGVNLGDMLVFFCAISFALQIVLTGKYAPQFPALILAFVQISTVALLSCIGAAFQNEWSIVLDSPDILLENVVLWALLICALPATVFAFVAQTELQTYTTPTRVALIFATEPVFAGLTDGLWNQNWLSSLGVIGCLLILAGMILSELKFTWGEKNAKIIQIKKQQGH
ncbi:DMT family transporter [Caldalkalibacillus mannanilyticus]|uniref:DMT family transporter n=1 Tax=Caldalkalibacillus mannanilyticus TaxID=1418 RepID=UPI000469C458|nr:DMT family transporter [Caldalkalibacillus mannanilyticus]